MSVEILLNGFNVEQRWCFSAMPTEQYVGNAQRQQAKLQASSVQVKPVLQPPFPFPPPPAALYGGQCRFLQLTPSRASAVTSPLHGHLAIEQSS